MAVIIMSYKQYTAEIQEAGRQGNVNLVLELAAKRAQLRTQMARR